MIRTSKIDVACARRPRLTCASLECRQTTVAAPRWVPDSEQLTLDRPDSRAGVARLELDRIRCRHLRDPSSVQQRVKSQAKAALSRSCAGLYAGDVWGAWRTPLSSSSVSTPSPSLSTSAKSFADSAEAWADAALNINSNLREESNARRTNRRTTECMRL